MFPTEGTLNHVVYCANCGKMINNNTYDMHSLDRTLIPVQSMVFVSAIVPSFTSEEMSG